MNVRLKKRRRFAVPLIAGLAVLLSAAVAAPAHAATAYSVAVGGGGVSRRGDRCREQHGQARDERHSEPAAFFQAYVHIFSRGSRVDAPKAMHESPSAQQGLAAGDLPGVGDNAATARSRAVGTAGFRVRISPEFGHFRYTTENH